MPLKLLIDDFVNRINVCVCSLLSIIPLLFDIRCYFASRLFCTKSWKHIWCCFSFVRKKKDFNHDFFPKFRQVNRVLYQNFNIVYTTKTMLLKGKAFLRSWKTKKRKWKGYKWTAGYPSNGRPFNKTRGLFILVSVVVNCSNYLHASYMSYKIAIKFYIFCKVIPFTYVTIAYIQWKTNSSSW